MVGAVSHLDQSDGEEFVEQHPRKTVRRTGVDRDEFMERGQVLRAGSRFRDLETDDEDQETAEAPIDESPEVPAPAPGQKRVTRPARRAKVRLVEKSCPCPESHCREKLKVVEPQSPVGKDPSGPSARGALGRGPLSENTRTQAVEQAPGDQATTTPPTGDLSSSPDVELTLLTT